MATNENPFIHLRCRSANSLLEGAIQISALRDLCLHYGMPALALTDTNNLFGALEFSETMAKAGVQPIIGLTLDVVRSENANHGAVRGSLAFLAQTRAGYENLMALSSKAFLDVEPTENPHVGWQDIKDHADGLIALTGGYDGIIDGLIRSDHEDTAKSCLDDLADCFGDCLAVELQRHGRAGEKQSEVFLLNWAAQRGVPAVATNEPYFAKQEMYEAHDALICIAEGSYLSVEERRHLTQEHYFKSGRAMATLFEDLPEAISNTALMARRCSYRPQTHQPILPNFTSGAAHDEAEELAVQARAGLQDRLDKASIAGEEKEYWDRLDYELGVINKMGFPGYFLIVADFIKWAKGQGIPVGPGRGSGAGSLVAWALTITDLDPIHFGLLFERFLNPERVSMPDFDIDFCQERRGEVIDYVRERYGDGRVAQIITIGTLQPRVVLRDVGRVMQLPLGMVDRLAKLVPSNPANPMTLKEAIRAEPKIQFERDSDEDVAQLLQTALSLEGLYRNASTHAAGVVIGDRSLVELVPLYRDPRSDIPATQFSMKWAEAAGLVKFDFLGLKTLTVISCAVKLLQKRGINIDISSIPLDDGDTYAMLSRADTVGIFQLESAGMREVLRTARPDCIEDIIAIVALYRPGPMENIPKYTAVKHGREKPLFLHDKITPITAETYGVIIYQEQVMQIAQVLSGFSLGEADLLRRAMGKKIKSEMQAQRKRFVSGAVKNGVEAKQAEHIFDLVDKFAGYGFNKSHSAAYALVAYQTAWLKAHYPVELLSALMTLDAANTDKLSIFVHEAKRLDIVVRGPDINASEADFSVQNGEIYYALGAVRNVSKTAMDSIVEERKKHGAFKNLYDFAERVEPSWINKRALENLARAGAFDQIEPNRAKVLKVASLILAASQHAARERASAQGGLFGDGPTTGGRTPFPDVPVMRKAQQMEEELQALGFYLSAHPIDMYKDILKEKNTVLICDMLEQVEKGRHEYCVGGIVRASTERNNASGGRRYGFLNLSDASGECELLVPGECLDKSSNLLVPGTAVLVYVKADKRNEETRFSVKYIQALEKNRSQSGANLRVTVKDAEAVLALKKCFDELPKRPAESQAQLHLSLYINADEVVDFSIPGKWPADDMTCHAIKSLRGVVDATLLHDKL